MSQTIAIKTIGLSKVFTTESKKITALDEVYLNVYDNEFFTLLGPSGCGKTTLLRTIAGFEYPDKGEILLFDQNIANKAPYERSVNTVFQHYALFPHLTVFENISFGLYMLGQSEADIKQNTAHMLELVEMQDFENRYPQQLSGGQQQRIALARALAPKPQVLLLDEPLSALDLKLRQNMQIELKKLQRNTGTTFIFVTHDQEEALTMSDRIAVMAEGKIKQLGSPGEIYEYPNNRFVADFIGGSNFLYGKIHSIEKNIITCRLKSDDYIEAELPEQKQKMKIGENIKLIIRPEKLSIYSLKNEENIPAKNITASIVENVYQGTFTKTLASMRDNTQIVINNTNVVDHSIPYKKGEIVKIYASPKAFRILKE